MKEYIEKILIPMKFENAVKFGDVEFTHNKKFGFDYVKPDEFKKLREKNEAITVTGYIRLKTIEADEKCDKLINVHDNEEDNYFELHTIEKEKDIKHCDILGYVSVGDDEYVALTRSYLPVLILLFLLLGLLFGLLFFGGRPENKPVDNKPSLEFEQGEDIPEPEFHDAIVETIDIPGYSDMTLSDTKPAVNLTNPEGNTVYFVYRLSEGETVIHETKAIEPGKMVQLDLKSLLSVGEHEITFEIMTYDVTTQTTCNGTVQTVSVTIQ